MRRLHGVNLFAGLAIALVAFASTGASAPSDAMKALAILEMQEKTPTPDVALPTLEGRPLALRELRGQVLLVNFWATWCLPCQWEMPLMEKLYQAYRDQGFVVVAISVDQQGAAVVKPFVESRKLTYPVLLDTKLEGATKFGLLGIPATFLIGRDGLIKGVTYGPKEWDGKEARAVIESLLGSAKPGKPGLGG